MLFNRNQFNFTCNMLFHKMHGLGNDFIILESTNPLEPKYVKQLCHRHHGIGADQIITYSPDYEPKVAFYNSDGTTAEQCGNGIRCLAWLLMKQRQKHDIRLCSPTQHHSAWLLENDQVCIEMGQPQFTWENQPISQQLDLLDVFTSMAHKPDMSAVSMGNPHAIIFIPNPTIDIAKRYGPYIENHRLFPNKTNAHFVDIQDRNIIHMIPWERGTGITEACGSGACAAHAAALKKGLIDPICTVRMPGGLALLETRKSDGVILLTADVEYVFKGEISG